MDVKGIVEKVIAGLVGAAILAGIGWAAGKFSAPELPSIRAEYIWMEVPNPVFVTRDPLKFAEVDKPFGISGLGQYLGQAGPSAKVGKLTVRNASRVRSKKIEISANTGGLVSTDTSVKGQELRKQILLGSLDGEASAEFIVVSDAGYYKEPSVKVIYDDKLIDVQQLVPDRHFPDIRDYVWIMAALLFVGAITTVILVAIVLVWLYSLYDPDVYIRSLTPAQVKVMIEKVEAIRERFPDKMPKPAIPNSP